jgi:hypothetical protein
MASSDAQISFGSWLRRGLAAGIDIDDVSTPTHRTTTVVRLRLDFNGIDHVASPRLTLVGPGDIAGLDARVVVRTFPAADVNDAEAAFLVALDFDQADLPWRYTPARNTGNRDPQGGPVNDKLRPWVTLVVLEESEIVKLVPASATQKLPILTTSIANLPDLGEAWAWAEITVIRQLPRPSADPARAARPHESG